MIDGTNLLKMLSFGNNLIKTLLQYFKKYIDNIIKTGLVINIPIKEYYI